MKKTVHSEKSKKLQALLIQARLDAGLTQQQLAEKLGKPQSFVAKYEGGERRLDVIEFTHICTSISVSAPNIIKKVLE